MKDFSLLVKPASYNCNLNCDYCFYLCKSNIFPGTPHRMNNEVLKRMISSFLFLEMPVHAIGWQGGEPTIMGIDFFRSVVGYQQKFGRSGQIVSNGIQTNGILLNDELCKLFHEYKFLVGISIDGPAQIHNIHRKTISGEESHSLVMKGLECLKKHNVEFNVLTLVSDANAEKPVEVYNYLKEIGAFYHQYIECVEFAPDGKIANFAVQPAQWGNFLCAIFDEWFKNDTRTVSVRLFDAILNRLVDGATTMCTMADDCRTYLVVEYNGNIYPCDFYVEPELLLGNIMSAEWKDFLSSDIYKNFGERKRNVVEKCVECEYLSLCRGCCPKNRFGRGKERNISWLCEGWKIFFSHTIERFRILAAQIKEEREKNMRIQRYRNPKIGRNSPCPCGSGKKYKICCGK